MKLILTELRHFELSKYMQCKSVLITDLHCINLHGIKKNFESTPPVINCTSWRPVVAVFYYIPLFCNRNIVSRDFIILIYKLGVTVGILLITFWNRL